MDRGATVRIFRLFAAVALMGSASAFALDVDPAFDRFKAVVTGNTVEVKFSPSGVPLAGSSGPLTATGISGAGYLSRSASIATQHGPLPFTVSQRFSVSSLARGASLLAGPLGVGLSIAAPFIYQWYLDAGVQIDAQGVPRSQTAGSIVCSMNTPGGVPRPGYVWATGTTNYLGGWCGESPAGYPHVVSAAGTVISVTPGGLSGPLSASQISQALAVVQRSPSQIESILAEGIKYPEFTPDSADTPQVLNPQPSPAKTSSGTTVDPSTGTTTQTRSCSMIGSPSSSGNVITVSEICTTATTTVPPGGTTGTTVVGTTTTGIGVSVGSGQPTETPPFEMPCGVGSAPPCAVKIDESGTPPPTDGDNSQNESGDAAEAGKNQILDKIEELEDWTLPGWSWTFSLPTGCTPLPMFLGVVVDPCQWIDEIHSIMSVIWVLTGIAGMFVIFSKAD